MKKKKRRGQNMQKKKGMTKGGLYKTVQSIAFWGKEIGQDRLLSDEPQHKERKDIGTNARHRKSCGAKCQKKEKALKQGKRLFHGGTNEGKQGRESRKKLNWIRGKPTYPVMGVNYKRIKQPSSGRRWVQVQRHAHFDELEEEAREKQPVVVLLKSKTHNRAGKKVRGRERISLKRKTI